MKRIFALIFATLISSFLIAQKVDIDNFRVDMEVANLPEKYIEEDKRTYSVQVQGSNPDALKKENFKLYGYKQVEKDGTLKIVISVGELIPGVPSQSTRTVENKDKNGKVTSKTHYYTYSGTNSSNCTVTIYGPMSQKEIDEEIAKDKKDKPAENPFLKNASNSAPAADSKEESEKYKKIKFSFLNTSYEHTGSESTSATVALNSYNAGSGVAFTNHVKRMPDDAMSQSQSIANKIFGFFPYKLSYQKMKILDSDKHPEYKTFQQATEASKVIFKNFKYNSDIEAFRKDFAPILDYFTALEGKLGSTEKNDRKLKAAALYNIAMINFSLDNFAESEKACKKMIAIDQDKGDAEDILEKIKEVTVEMAKHKMITRHIKDI